MFEKIMYEFRISCGFHPSFQITDFAPQSCYGLEKKLEITDFD